MLSIIFLNDALKDRRVDFRDENLSAMESRMKSFNDVIV